MGSAAVTRIVSLDFELAGVLDLGDVGADVWTKDKDTLPILAGFAIGYEEPRAIGFDLIADNVLCPAGQKHKATERARALERELLRAVDDGAEIHCWNANFEWSVWNNICAPRFHWPALPIERFHCTMATAACAGLPMSLDEAAIAVGSPYLKDKGGQALMTRMARPRRIDPDGAPRWWHREDEHRVELLVEYNLADVRAEREVHLRMPRMTQREREIWLADQRMNARGLPVDLKLLGDLSALTLVELFRFNREIARVTNGAVSGATANVKLLAWVQARGYPHNTLEKDTLDHFINSSAFVLLDPDVSAVLLFRAEAAKTSTAKLRTIARYSMHDGVARNLIQYGGAVRTLRWAGRGPQIQNFPRPIIEHVPEAIDAILDGIDENGLRLLFGRPLDVVSSCLRGVFKAPPGKMFAICDYHAIEAIVLAWLANDEALLNVFRRGENVYLFTAQSVGSNDRKLGKVLRLACGYGMGHVKFQETALGYRLKLTLDEARAAVNAFRAANPLIVSLWHLLEAFAIKAIQNPTSDYQCGKLRIRMADEKDRLKGALLIRLPSGRSLVYRNARVEHGRIIFWGVDQFTRRWKELDTYGGKLVENATQAVARDLLAEAVVNIDREFPNTLCTTVHDEVIGMANGEDVAELFDGMKLAMSTPPAWASGMPLTAAGAISERYCKI
jgi:DNA polymerase